MNKQRRAIIDAALGALNTAKDELEATLSQFTEALRGVASLVEQARDGEQDAYDNLSEGLQNGERGQSMQEAIDNLDSAVAALDDLNFEENIEEFISEVTEALNQAKGET